MGVASIWSPRVNRPTVPSVRCHVVSSDHTVSSGQRDPAAPCATSPCKHFLFMSLFVYNQSDPSGEGHPDVEPSSSKMSFANFKHAKVQQLKHSRLAKLWLSCSLKTTFFELSGPKIPAKVSNQVHLKT